MQAHHVREQLTHPVLDCDGHWVEPIAIFLDYLRDEAGAAASDRYLDLVRGRTRWYGITRVERTRRRVARPAWWTHPTNARDRATAMLPGLLYERLDEFGIDVALVYSSLAIALVRETDRDLRCASIRALNTMNAELFRPFADRLVPVAAVCTFDPDEAIHLLDHAVVDLGMKAVMLNGRNLRQADDGGRPYIDTIGLDSPLDYEAFWARCVELGVAVTDHAGAYDSLARQSTTNFVFNHVGHFAEAMAASAKAIFLGGVTRRHPDLNFAFLEGGVGFACSVLFDLESHWDKRHVDALERDLRPTNVDRDQFARLFEQYANGRLAGRLEDVARAMEFNAPFASLEDLVEREEGDIDEFAAIDVRSKRELRAAFTRNFYFGCESDDVMTAVAFDRRLDTGLKPIFGSDIGHFDVPDMAHVLSEAWELVEDGLMSEADFEAFTFSNGVALHTSLNPSFFEGTRIEAAVKGVMPAPAENR